MASLCFAPPKKVCNGHRTRLYLELLESRCLLSTVTNLTDHDPGSLRDAIANTPPGGTVNFQAGLNGRITLTSATLSISKDVTLAGPGASVITISGNQTFQVFNIGPTVTATISGLTIANGRSPLFGGGISNDGMLTLSNSTITNNSSGNRGGGIYNSPSGTMLVNGCTISGNSTPNAGGGIYNAGVLTVSKSTFSGDGSLGADGGAIYSAGTATVRVCNFVRNGGSQAYGGAIRNDGDMTIDDPTFSEYAGPASSFSGDSGALGGDIYNVGTLTINSRFRSGLDVYNIGILRPGTSGGSLLNYGTLTISNRSFSGHHAHGSDAAGAIWNAPSGDLTLINCTVSNNSSVFTNAGGIYNMGRLTVENCVFSGNYSDDNGGAIYNEGTVTVTVSGCTFSRNYGEESGAISGGILTISDSTFADNASQIGVSAILASRLTMAHCVISGNRSDERGTIFAGTATIRDSTISANVASFDSAVSIGVGTISNCTISGNIVDSGALNNSGILTISNCTISGNEGFQVGGIANSGTLVVSNSTISGNAAYDSLSPQTAGGIANFGSDATGLLLNSTIANNTVASNNRTASQLYSGPGRFGPGTGKATIQFRNTLICGSGSRPNLFADVNGAFVSQGHNLSSDDGSGFLAGPGDLINTNPLLGPLQNNGGPTQTMALLPGSPAIDVGDNTDAPDFDQRGPGFPRIVGGVIDIGAFEVQPGPATHLQISAPAQVTSNTPFDVTVTALDAYGHTAAGYLDIVSFSSSDLDPGVVLPSDYTFTAQDGSVHTFPAGVILITPGDQTLTVTDTNGLSGSVLIQVIAPAPPPAGCGTQRDKGPDPGVAVEPISVGMEMSASWVERSSSKRPIFLAMEEGVDELFTSCLAARPS